MKRRRLKAIITKIRRQKVTVPAATFRAYCAVCESEVEILNAADAARILGVEKQTLEELVLVGKVHAVQTVNGNFWICKDSLFQTGG